MRHKSKNKTRPLFTLSLEMTRLVNKTRLLLVPCVNSDIYGNTSYLGGLFVTLKVLHLQHNLHAHEILISQTIRIQFKN